MRNIGAWLSSAALCAALAGGALAGDAGDGKAATAEAPKTTLVTRGPFKVVVELQGAFDAREAVQVRWDTRVFTSELEVVEAVSAGAVEKGEVLVRVDTEPLDEQIAAAERDLGVARAALAAQTEEANRREAAAALALESARAESRNADEALRIFRETEMPLRIEESAHDLEGMRNWMQDQVEELKQLEKMYGDDDLTEETEEIVLHRAKRSLERTKKWIEFSVVRDKLLREVHLPRELESLELRQRRSAGELEKLEATSKPSLEQARLEFAKAQAALALQERQLERLRADRAALELQAPVAGLVVPAELVRGKWNGLDDGARALRKGGKLKPNAVLFTIVQPGAVSVATTVPEASLFQVKQGLAAEVVPTAAPDAPLAAKVAYVARVSAGTDYEVRLDLDGPAPLLVPGNTCKVKVTVSEKPDALTVPVTAVERDGDKTFVHLTEGGNTVRAQVKLGGTNADRVEIVAGVVEGAAVLETAPQKK